MTRGESGTTPELRAARDAVRADEEAIIARYVARESIQSIAAAYGVWPAWLKHQLQGWGVSLREAHEAYAQHKPVGHLFKGRRARRSSDEMREARAEFDASRESVIARYGNGESINALARSFQVDSTWAGQRLDDWGVPRHERPAAPVMRSSRSTDPSLGPNAKRDAAS